MIPYFAIGKWVVIALIIGGLLLTVKVQTVRVNSLKVEVKTVKQELDNAIKANEINVATIDSLKKDVLRITKSYDGRLLIKDKLIADLRKICGTGDANVNPITGNALLDELNRMWVQQSDSPK